MPEQVILESLLWTCSAALCSVLKFCFPALRSLFCILTFSIRRLFKLASSSALFTVLLNSKVKHSGLIFFYFFFYAGTVSVWSLMFGREPIHRYQHNQRIQALALGSEGATVATASGFEVKVESPNDRGFWQTTQTFEIQKLVSLQATQLHSKSSRSTNYFWYS